MQFKAMDDEAADQTKEIEELETELTDKDVLIEELKAELLRREEEARLRALENRPVLPRTTNYKCLKGDAVDELLAMFLNQLDYFVPVQRVNEGTYNFGRLMKVYMRIANGKLTVRVGGGYMTVMEFLEQHGETEALWYEEHVVAMTTVGGDATLAFTKPPGSGRRSVGGGAGSPRASGVPRASGIRGGSGSPRARPSAK